MTRVSRDRKTKVKMCTDVQMVEQVKQFRYLGSLILEHGYCEKDIRSRIEIAKKAFMDKKYLFTSTMNFDKNHEVCDLECGTVCSRDMDTDIRV